MDSALSSHRLLPSHLISTYIPSTSSYVSASSIKIPQETGCAYLLGFVSSVAKFLAPQHIAEDSQSMAKINFTEPSFLLVIKFHPTNINHQFSEHIDPFTQSWRITNIPIITIAFI